MDAQDARRVRVIYRGRVQGVGFRATCAAIARRWTLSGFVRNEPDGSVSLEAQGTPSDVDQFLAAVAAHMQANISTAESSELPTVSEDFQFRVTY